MRTRMRLVLVVFAGLALIVPAVALAKTTHWFGSTKFPCPGCSGGFANDDLEFNVSRNEVTYVFLGYECSTSSSPGAEETFPTSAPIRHGKFKIDFIEPSGRNPVSHLPYGAPGFHVIMKGDIAKHTAHGTTEVLYDPLSGGACNTGTVHWHAHRT